MKKTIVLVLVCTMFLCLLTGCFHEHVWTAADCENPETCECGETQGEALGHTLTEANFQQAPTCTVCGAVEGEPLPADFETYGMTDFMEVGKEYDYRTTAADGSDVPGKTTVVSYETIVSDEENRVFREGYTWHVVSFDTVISDSNGLRQGFNYGFFIADYYDIKGLKDGADHTDPHVSSYPISYNGEKMLVYLGQTGDYENNPDGSLTFHYQVNVHKPDGYDGCVVGLNNGKFNLSSEEYYINDVYAPVDFVMFRIPA